MTERVVLVTGGNRGIGLATADHFRSLGHRVAVTYRSTPPARDDLLAVRCDVTDRASVAEAFSSVTDQLGPVEVLVANAGITDDRLALRMTDEQFTAVLDTNLTGAFRVAREALGPMVRARWGRIVFIGSVSGTIGQAGQANYSASKAGLVGLARSLAREVASRAITVNVVAPGPVATDLLAALGPDRIEAMAEATPIGRLATSAEVAAAVAHLAGDHAGATTGAVLAVDGGLGLGPW